MLNLLEAIAETRMQAFQTFRFWMKPINGGSCTNGTKQFSTCRRTKQSMSCSKRKSSARLTAGSGVQRRAVDVQRAECARQPSGPAADRKGPALNSGLGSW
ncbi:hypothetical protein PO124_23575 [Bacillus licheniformis]|nr:hypothetical protein [Bacillus licheniformis]